MKIFLGILIILVVGVVCVVCGIIDYKRDRQVLQQFRRKIEDFGRELEK